MTIVTITPLDGKRPETYPKGRICSHAGCDTILSQYTKGPRCSVHGRIWYPISEREQRTAFDDLRELMEE